MHQMFLDGVPIPEETQHPKANFFSANFRTKQFASSFVTSEGKAGSYDQRMASEPVANITGWPIPATVMLAPWVQVQAMTAQNAEYSSPWLRTREDVWMRPTMLSHLETDCLTLWALEPQLSNACKSAGGRKALLRSRRCTAANISPLLVGKGHQSARPSLTHSKAVTEGKLQQETREFVGRFSRSKR